MDEKEEKLLESRLYVFPKGNKQPSCLWHSIRKTIPSIQFPAWLVSPPVRGLNFLFQSSCMIPIIWGEKKGAVHLSNIG